MNSLTKLALKQSRQYMDLVKDSIHDYSHARRVANNARILSSFYPKINKDLIKIASYWHDTGRHKGEDKHELRSAVLTKNFLLKNNFSELYAQNCFLCIYKHKWTDKPDTLGGKIIYDADKLDLISTSRWKKAYEKDPDLTVAYLNFIKKNMLPILRDKLLKLPASKILFDKRIEKFKKQLNFILIQSRLKKTIPNHAQKIKIINQVLNCLDQNGIKYYINAGFCAKLYDMDGDLEDVDIRINSYSLKDVKKILKRKICKNVTLRPPVKIRDTFYNTDCLEFKYKNINFDIYSKMSIINKDQQNLNFPLSDTDFTNLNSFYFDGREIKIATLSQLFFYYSILERNHPKRDIFILNKIIKSDLLDLRNLKKYFSRFKQVNNGTLCRLKSLERLPN